jgi:UDP-N-acetylglucosamine:LPS N-acetylglucosamine transferase
MKWRMKNITLIYFNAGGGHRAAALALEEVIRQQQRPWHVRLVNLTEVLDPKDSFRKLTGLAPEDLYNKRLARGWTLGLAQELKLLQAMIRLSHATLVRRLQQHWLQTEPDLVVSLIPNFNRALCESVTTTLPGVPFVTVLTDMADHPPHFWIEPGQHQHLVCGTPRAVDQARAAGVALENIFLTTGMILRPSFYEHRERPQGGQRIDVCQSLGLDPNRPIGMLLFGGQGSMQMVSMARALRDVQLILMCGHNQVLADKLKKLERAAPSAVVGFTSDVAGYMGVADFLVGKPGPGSISEALHMGLPVITCKNAWTMPQERYNADWLAQQGAGLVLSSMRELPAAAARLLADLPRYQDLVRQLDNRAVYELPEIFADLMLAAAAPTGIPTGTGSSAPGEAAAAARTTGNASAL